jgi:hypothetical protein
MLEAADKFGAYLDSGTRYKQQLLDAGFVDVVETIYKWPTNPWPRDPKFKEMGESASTFELVVLSDTNAQPRLVEL